MILVVFTMTVSLPRYLDHQPGALVVTQGIDARAHSFRYVSNRVRVDERQSSVLFERNPEAGETQWWFHAEDRRTESLIATVFDEREPSISPDGKWLAFQSNQTGRYEIYVVSPSDPQRMWQVTRNGGREPLWTREGREIVYRDGNRILSIAFSGDTNEPAFDKPEKLFEEESLWPGHRNYDVTADGERFLMVRVQRSSGTHTHQRGVELAGGIGPTRGLTHRANFLRTEGTHGIDTARSMGCDIGGDGGDCY